MKTKINFSMKILDHQNISSFICVKKFHFLKKICFGKKKHDLAQSNCLLTISFIKIDGLRLVPIMACFYITQPF